MALPAASNPVAAHYMAVSTTSATWLCPVEASTLSFTNNAAVSCTLSINGATPTLNGDNFWFLAPVVGASLDVTLVDIPQAEVPPGYTGPVVQIIASGSGNVYIRAS
jgi:hypothetical protein